MTTAARRRVAVIGGGVAGLSAAWSLAKSGVAVEVFESDNRWGGKVLTTPFAGLPAVDAGADAFLARVPEARALAVEVGLGGELVSPATGSALVVRRDRLHPIPDGLMLGVPTGFGGLARSRLLTVRGKLRAAAEPLLPRREHDDSLGALIGRRFGREVDRYLVDPLVGSINAGDSDRLSLAASVPQIASPAERHRSLLLGLRRAAPPKSDAPVFLTPERGMGSLVAALTDALESAGVVLWAGHAVTALERDGETWRLTVAAPGGSRSVTADAVVVATPARSAAELLTSAAPDTARLLGRVESAGVVMVTAAIPAAALGSIGAMSGYLVPKPEQRHVTAVSFASRKWRHWEQPGVEIVRISLGRDGNATPLDLDDAAIEAAALGEVGRHLGLGSGLQALDIRITRWPGAFPQYRPGHVTLAADIEAAVEREARGLALCGASYRGIGLPACIRDGARAAALALSNLNAERPD